MVENTLRNQLLLILEATETAEPLFLFNPGRRLAQALLFCGGLGREIVVLRIVFTRNKGKLLAKQAVGE